MTASLQARLETAVMLAERAGALALSMRPPPGAARGTLKSQQNWVTEADLAVERFLSEQLAVAFPSDGFQGEEGGVSRGGSLRWVADPIDGTSNFARGAARFCVSLGCLEGETPLIGVVVAPALIETVSAARGRGVWLNGQPVRVAKTRDPAQAIFEVGWSRRRPNADYLKVCDYILAGGSSLRHGGSGTLGLVDVATGRLDGFAELHIHLWDVAAALVILQEAGAVTSDFMGGMDAEDGNGIVACTPGLAPAWGHLPGMPVLPAG